MLQYANLALRSICHNEQFFKPLQTFQKRLLLCITEIKRNENYIKPQKICKLITPYTTVNISVADRIRIIISSAGSLSTSIFLIVIAATLPSVLVTDPKNLQQIIHITHTYIK